MEKILCGFTLPLAYDGEADAVYAGDVLVAELFADEPKLGRIVAAAPELLAAAKKSVGDGDCYGHLSENHRCSLMDDDKSKWCSHCLFEDIIERVEEPRDE